MRRYINIVNQLNYNSKISLRVKMKQQQREDKKVKIFYLDEQREWSQYTQATLRLQSREGGGLNLMFYLEHNLASNKLAVLPLIQIYRESEKAICIQMGMISQVQKLDELILALKLDEWNRILSISFRDVDYCSIILEQIQLQLQSNNQLPCQPQQYLKYLQDEIASSPVFIDWLFQNQNATQQFFSFVENNSLSLDDQRGVFRIVKYAFMRGSRNIIYTFLKDQYFITLLRCLSMNYEFGDRRVDYSTQYLKIQRRRNIFQFQSQELVEKYRNVIKSRYLVDFPTSMFIEMHTQIIFQDIIRESTITIITILKDHPNFFNSYKQLAKQDPVTYVQVFSQIWEMFKLIPEDSFSCEPKNQLYMIFRRENLLKIALECIIRMVEQNKANLRVYQKFIQALNPFLSYKWNQSQQFLLQLYRNNQPHLIQALKCILSLNDYHTKSIVLTNARYFVQTNQNRKRMKQAFYSYVFGQFVGCIEEYFNTAQQLQIFVTFLVKCYKVDYIRTRRCIIESSLVSKLQSKSKNKYIVIVILKFLRGLLQTNHYEIFNYFQNNQAFRCLSHAYSHAKKCAPRGILYSMFIGLLKDCKAIENSLEARVVYDILRIKQQEMPK